jgi:hypothetical protein
VFLFSVSFSVSCKSKEAVEVAIRFQQHCYKLASSHRKYITCQRATLNAKRALFLRDFCLLQPSTFRKAFQLCPTGPELQRQRNMETAFAIATGALVARRLCVEVARMMNSSIYRKSEVSDGDCCWLELVGYSMRATASLTQVITRRVTGCICFPCATI